MEKMNTKTMLIPMIVALALFLVSFASAAELDIQNVEFNSMILSPSASYTETVNVGNTVPVLVHFTTDNISYDVEVEVELEGEDDVDASKEVGTMEANSRRAILFNLEVPARADERNDEYTLYVTITSDAERIENSYTIKVQRESDELSVLSVDYNTQISAGETFPVSVVIKNTGYDRGDDNYVVASIPALGISSRTYAGDLIPTEDYMDYDDEEDSAHDVVYLQVPQNAPAGVYELVIEAYNDDAETQVTKLISIEESSQTTVLAATKSQDISAGESADYSLIIVNSANTARVFQLSAVSSEDLIVTVPSVVAVGAGASETITVKATVPSDTEEGTYTFSADVEGKQVVFAANVIGNTGTVSSSIVGLTVVLVIVFVVLLAVLIILISRKDNTVEEVETSYY
jgi:hypothetical protein